MASAVIKTINGRRFSIAKLPATDGLKLQIAVAKLVGSELADLAGMAKRQGLSEAAILGEIGEVLERVAGKADADAIVKLMLLAFSKVTCEGRPIVDIDLTFGDNAIEPWQVFVEALKVNLGDFLAVVRSDGSQQESAKT